MKSKEQRVKYSTALLIQNKNIKLNFRRGEVKEFKEVREVKAICFITKYTTKKAIGYNF